MLKKVENITDYEKYFALSRPEMLEYLPDVAERILEVGCGEGYFGNAVKSNFDCDYWGVEPFPEAAEKAKGKLDKVFNSGFDEAYSHLPKDYFNCVIFNDVLEHIANPFDTLEKLHRILPKGAKIVSSIPNVRYALNLYELLFKRDWEYKHEGGILDFTHLRFFTKKSIHRMFENSGYRILRINGINPIPNYKFIPFNIMTLGLFSDSKYLQYAVVAEKK
ncbi:MAG: class I SAM-dependent methyltransferase [Candidatus Kapabacteria bacterium]|nr:class I SAM-dependent methyltransferase [Ignavibacteriota bacterium]MCW5886096.1 class I SAM-dependent methyltransferase [Candidatus Kapabacteria bacterium]